MVLRFCQRRVHLGVPAHCTGKDGATEKIVARISLAMRGYIPTSLLHTVEAKVNFEGNLIWGAVGCV